MVELSGRDLTSLLIDTKTTEKWTNQTSSQIATTLATRHGLTPVVTDTTTKVGKYYEIDHIRLTDKRSEWDLLTWLAREEQFVVFVRGQSLYFQPKPDPTQTTPYVLRWTPPSSDSASPQFNGMSVKFRRSLTLARDIIVTVHSWNMKNAQGFSQTVHATHNKFTVLAGAPQPTGDAQVFSYTIPGLSPEQALERAQKILAELTQHEMNLDARLPADNLLDVDGIVLVQGTGTAFDQAYYPDSIKRSMSKSEGYVMHIHAKNHSPESVVIA
jgi:phage protein D